MKHKHTRLLFTGLAMILLLCAIVKPATALGGKMIEVFGGVTVYMDDKLLHPVDVNGQPVEAFIYNGTTYLPVRAVAEAVGKDVYWDSVSASVYLGGHEKPKPREGLKIGVFVPTSGSEAYYGNDMLQSYQLAVDEINAAGGILGQKLQLVHADDGCDPHMAIQAAKRLLAAEADFMVGGYCSGVSIAMLPYFNDANKVVLLSASNSTRIKDMGYKQTFMLNSPANHCSYSLGRLCNSLGVAKMAVIHQGDDYGKALADSSNVVMPDYGVSIVTTQMMEKDAHKIDDLATAVLASGADIVYWCGYYVDGGTLIKQLRQHGYQGVICTGDGSADTHLIANSGEAGEGIYVISPPYVNMVAGGEEFIAKYQSEYGSLPGPYASLSYDTIYVLKDAIEKAGSTEFAPVREAMQSIEYQGLSGLIKFAPNRELADSNFIILQIKNGTFTQVEL